MKVAGIRKKIITSLAVALATAVTVVAGILAKDALVTKARDSGPGVAHTCSFVIPPEFVPSTQPGLFINRNHPMESSSIQYSYYDNGKDVLMTNREKEAAAQAVIPPTEEPELLTREVYQETIAAAYNSKYGQDVGFAVSSFDRIIIDGFPGFKIESSYKVEEEETVYQTVYMLVSNYRIFTVTYQRAADDDCIGAFAESAATIHVCE